MTKSITEPLKRGLKGRPSEYLAEYVERVDDYLNKNEDEYVELVKVRNVKTGREEYEQKLKVNLPTIEGFADFLDVSKFSIYEWAKDHEGFSNALEKIRSKQKMRLMEKGLSGEYNSTIAKLILSSNHGMVERTEGTQKHLHVHAHGIVGEIESANEKERIDFIEQDGTV